MLGRHHDEALLSGSLRERECDLRLVKSFLAVRSVVHLDTEGFSTGDQSCRVAVLEVQRLSTRCIDGFHRRERAAPGLSFPHPNENVGIRTTKTTTTLARTLQLIR